MKWSVRKRSIVLKKIIILFLFVSSATGASESRHKVAEALIEAMQMDYQFQVMADNLRALQARQINTLGLDPKAKPVIDKYLEDMTNLLFTTLSQQNSQQQYAEMYAKAFSEKELRDILAFYQSETGQAFLKHSPEIMAGFTQIAESQLASIQDQLIDLQQTFQSDLAQFNQ